MDEKKQQQEQQKQAVKTTQHTLEEWASLYNGKYLVGYPEDTKPKMEKPLAEEEGEQKMDDAEPEDRGPTVDEPTSDSDEETKEGEEKDKPKKQLVNWAELPHPVRVIWPGSRVTRDLRLNRLNIICDAKDLIIKVDFY
ncbi:hypothetical protein GGI00_005346 [Coemansia sp. RSA 2681]|nr:hypothetical protein GGI00_005346 [Coemansia sp. RSA 2681]